MQVGVRSPPPVKILNNGWYVQRITGHLSLAQSESRTKETVIHELSSKLQALEKENKDLRDKVSRADDTERQNLARVQQTLGGENESLKAQVYHIITPLICSIVCIQDLLLLNSRYSFIEHALIKIIIIS